MSVYVDQLRDVYPHIDTDSRSGFRYDRACHLMAESEDELDSFAKKLGCPIIWKHGDHYDLTANKRIMAVRNGAIETTTRMLVTLRRKQP